MEFQKQRQVKTRPRRKNKVGRLVLADIQAYFNALRDSKVLAQIQIR